MKKSFKIIFVFILTLSLFKSFNVSAKETDDLNDNVVIEEDLNGRVKSTSLPSSALNLSTSSYKANINYASTNWLYTNCYFKVASNNRIYISYNFNANSVIGVYDMSSRSWVSTTYGKDGSVAITGLNSTHKYAVAFKSQSSAFSINGYAIITK